MKKKGIRLAIVGGLVAATLGIGSPANATDCSDTKPGQQCGGCQLNRDFSTEDLRPIVCYV
jgi:hypothetical protein